MAQIKPFRGLRFKVEKAGKIEELTCPPYDIISEEQRKAYLLENEHNVIRLELPRGENPYEEAGRTLRKWEEEGIIEQDAKESLYIYEEEFVARGKRRSMKGFICRVKIEPFEKGVVLPHEETLSGAKADRFNLMKSCFCNFSQIYSLYRDPSHSTQSRIDRLSVGTPDIEMTDSEGVTHRMWIVSDEAETAALCAEFEERKLYIADGHHRYETSLNFRNWCREQGLAKEGDAADYVMMMLVDIEHEGLVVFPTHRLLRRLEGFDAAAAVEACRPYFEISAEKGVSSIEEKLEELYRQGEKAFAFYAGGEDWTLLTLKDKEILAALLPEKSAASQELDVTVLHTLILEKLFGIDAENMAKQINLTYTRNFDEAISSVRKGASQCAFLLNPTRVQEIRDVAAAGEKMPQKSTYFYPKLITGLVMNKLK